MRTYTLEQFAGLIGGEIIGGPTDRLVRGAAVDSRNVRSGQAFFAIKGERVDGHDFCAGALAGGAACAVVMRQLDVVLPQILVPSIEGALAAMAKGLIREWSPRIAAVTGSVGKTTVKAMLGRIASERWLTAVAPGNLNSELGMPIAIANADHDAEVAVLEFAMRGRGQVRELGEMAPPHVSLVTNVGVSHIELLGSRQAIAESKREIFETTAAEGTACLNLDDDFADELREAISCQTLTYAFDHDADVRGSASCQTTAGTELSVRYAGDKMHLLVPAPGEHQAHNALAAAAAALALGASLADIQSALSGFQPEPHRGQLLRSPAGFEIIDDCYNASPDSMSAALAVLQSRPCSGRRIAVLGDMLELGEISEDEHLALGQSAASHGVDILIAVGEYGRVIIEGAADVADTHYAKGIDQAVQLLEGRVAEGDSVLVKASRGLALENLVEELMDGGDDR